MSNHAKDIDVLVIGGGNAALCAAITAAERGARVQIVEAAPKAMRGGNSRHTRNFRVMHDAPVFPLIESYGFDEYFDDLLRVTGGKTDEKLARSVIEQTPDCLAWIQKQGVHFQPSLSGTLSLARTNAFFLGGGKALVNAYYRRAQALGVEVLYEAKVEHIEIKGARAEVVNLSHKGRPMTLSPKSLVIASGGFQANMDWLKAAWGNEAENFLIRGTPYNRGEVLKDLMDQGLQVQGDPTQCHAVAIDGRAPKFDGGIVTRLDCVPFSIVVNKNAARFYDEGEDVWPKRYAIWGRLVARQPDQVAYAIIDAKSIDLFMSSVFAPIKSDRIEGLGDALGLDPNALRETVQSFNAACRNDQEFRSGGLDGLATRGLAIEKTNWARPIDTPPFYGYPLRTGVTFTYLGLAVDQNAQCQGALAPIENMWAAGETMAGSILGQGYLAGFGMAIGTVFGRIAGMEAAKYAG